MASIQHPLGRQRRDALEKIRFRLPHIPMNWWILAALMLVGATAMLPVIQTSTAATTGYQTQQLEQQRTELRSEIASLESEIADMRSLDQIEAEASALGLKPATQPTYIEIDSPGPSPARLPGPYQPDPIPTPRIQEPWWHDLLDALPLPGS